MLMFRMHIDLQVELKKCVETMSVRSSVLSFWHPHVKIIVPTVLEFSAHQGNLYKPTKYYEWYVCTVRKLFAGIAKYYLLQVGRKNRTLTQLQGHVNGQVEKLRQTNTNTEVRQYFNQLLVNSVRALRITSAEMGLVQDTEMVLQLGNCKTMQADMCTQKIPYVASCTRRI